MGLSMSWSRKKPSRSLRNPSSASAPRDSRRQLCNSGAAETPEIPAAPETLGQLSRADSTIAHAYHGTRGLVFGGGWYRPDNAGYNDRDDVNRLASYLGSLDPERWTTADLGPPNAGEAEDERQDELNFARAALASLHAMYERAMAEGQIVICETI